MRINFKKVSVKNFLSFGNQETIFEYNKGIHAVTGHVEPGFKRNGVGKSSLLADSITFALYNKPIRKINKDKMVNTANKKGCTVEVEFTIKNKEYKIVRGVSPTFLKIWENDKEIEFDSMHNTQKWLENIIGISFNAFTNMIVLNVNHSKPFLEMTPQEKRPVLEDLLSLSIYGRMSKMAKDIHLTSRTEIKALESEIRKDLESLELSKKRRLSIEEETKKFEEEKNERLANLRSNLKKQQKEKSLLENNLENLDFSKLEELKTKLKETKEKLNKLNNKKYEYNKDKKDLEVALSQLEHSPHCPTCKTPTDNPIVKKFIQETRENLQSLISSIQKNEEKIQRGNITKEKLDKSISKLNKLKEKYQEITSKINNIDSKIENINESIEVESSRILNLSDIISEDYIKNKEEEIKLTEDKFKTANEKFKYFNKIRDLLGEEGIRKYIIKKVLPFLNKKVNHYLNILGSDYTIIFDSELNEKLIARNRDERPYASFSGGEKRRIDLALLLALMDVAKSQNSADTNILIMDEILDTSMDSDGVESFMEHLNESFKTLYPDKCIYIITHRKEIGEEHFDTIVNLVKKNGFTTIHNISN